MKYLKVGIPILILIVVSLSVFYVFNKPAKLSKHRLIKPESAAVKGQIAIVLDDWGYDPTVLSYLFEIKSPITISVLPNLRYSKQIAEDARKKGYQVMLHLPLESKSNERPEKDTLYCKMDGQELLQRLRQMLASVPGISGVNNHQGSKATEDERIMGIILAELKRERLFFLDSFSTNKSVCSKVSDAIGIRYAKRDIFLDTPPSRLTNEEQRAYIQGQLDKLYRIAGKRGYAIGIGHDRKITIEVLRAAIPQLKKKGIKFVFLSEFVKVKNHENY